MLGGANRLMRQSQQTKEGRRPMSKKILIVDDSGTVRQQVRLALTQGGFDVVEAGDGIEATEKLAQNADVAAMVCDVNMPRMNGIELLEKLAKDGNTVPTVM